MNCCGGHEPDNQERRNSVNEQGSHGTEGNHRHHFSPMMLGCYIVPILVITGLFFTGGFSGSNSLLILAAVLICPLMHLFMMPAMMKKGNSHHH
jgi:Protein of unknown function (DUF2933).